MIKYKVDLLAGYLHSRDGWAFAAVGSFGNFIGNDYYVAADYYVWQGFAFSARFDRLNQQITGVGGVGKQNNHDWTIGMSKILVPAGNISLPSAYLRSSRGQLS